MSKKKTFGIFFIILLAVLAKSCKTYFDSDFYGLYVSGRYIAQNGMMRENVFFVSEGYGTVIQQWLYCIIIYFIHLLFENAGLFVFVVIQEAFLWCLMSYYLKLKKCTAETGLIIPGLIILFANYMNLRPELLTLILIMLQINSLEKYKQSGKKAYLYLTPLLTVLHINLHGSYWIYHVVVMAAYLLPGVNRQRLKDSVIPLLLSFASVFINPYSIDNVLIFTKQSNIGLLGISELQPLKLTSPSMFFLVIAIYLLISSIKEKKAESLILAALIISVLVAKGEKNTFILAVVYVIIAGERESTYHKVYAKPYSMFLEFVIVTAGLLYTILLFTVPQKESISEPLYAAEYIRDNEASPEDVRIFNDFNSGSYFLYKGIGHVYIEPRTEPYSLSVNGKKDIISEYAYITRCNDKKELDEFFAEYDFDYVYVPYFLTALSFYLDDSENYDCVLVSGCYANDNPIYGYFGAKMDKRIPLYRLYKK